MDKLLKQYGDLFTEQLEVEASYKKMAEESTRKLFDKAKEKGTLSSLSLGQKLIDRSLDSVVENIRLFIEHTAVKKAGVKPGYALIVSDLLDIYKDQEGHLYNILSFTTFSVLLDSIFSKECGLSNMAQGVAAEIQREAKLEKYL